MEYVVIGIVATVIVIVLSRSLRSSPNSSIAPSLEMMRDGVNVVKITLAKNLAEHFTPIHGNSKAIRLASAVVNYVFSEPSSGGPDNFSFAKDNAQLINTSAGQIPALFPSCRIAVTQAVRVLVAIKTGKGDWTTGECPSQLIRLKELGIFVPNLPTPDWNIFSTVVNKYHNNR